MLFSTTYLTACDPADDGDIEALQAELDDADVEAAPALEASEDLVGTSHSRAPKTCKEWTPTPGMCEQANVTCEDPERDIGPCSVLTQCIKCDVDWSGGV